MKTTNSKKRLPRWFFPTLIWAGPMLLLGLFWRIFFHYYFNAVTWLLFVLIPGLCITRIIFLFRSAYKDWFKWLLAAVYIGVFLIVLFFAHFGPYRVYHATRRNAQAAFEQVTGKQMERFLPLDLGEPNTVIFHDYLSSALFWDEGSYILQCRYGPKEYEAAKAVLETRYSFRTEALFLQYKHSENPQEGIEPLIRLEDDEFRFLAPENGKDGYFVHNGFMIAANDKRREICYVVLRDLDTDIVSDLSEYLYRSCGWIFIRYPFMKFLPEILIW